MQSTHWFPGPPARKPGNELLGALLKGAVGLAVAGAFYLRGHVVLAGVAAGFALVFFLISLSAKGRAAVGKVFAVVGEWAGRVVGSVLLTAIFVLVLTPVRLVRRLAGADDLRIRHRKETSYWLACDPEEHKRRYAGAMFATEVRQSSGRRGVMLLVAVVVLLVAGEVGLRLRGHGHPLLYVQDPETGYHPAPDQKTVWRGAHLETNHFGMRAPERNVEKDRGAVNKLADAARPRGAFRVLALGSDGGLRVDQEALYARVLERTLTEKTAGRAPGAIEVWNMDVSGWGPASMRGYVQEFGTFDADVVVVTLVPGALEMPLQSLLQTRFLPVDRPPRLALEELLVDVVWQYRDERTVRHELDTATLRRHGAAECGRLAEVLRKRGVEMQVLVVAPDTELIPELREPFWELQYFLVGPGAHYREVPRTFAQGAFDPDDGSLTVTGHRALAEAMATELLDHSPKLRGWLGTSAP